jgi:GTPase
MFIDLVKIRIESGKGGSGANTFRQEKFTPKGGPDGGDGGRGGHIIFQANRNMNTLVDFHNNKIFKASEGIKGSGSRSHGKNAEDIILMVPLGTVVKDLKTGVLIKDMIIDGEQFIVARGGRGGKGNWHYRTSTRQAPTFYEKGEPGESREITLELKIMADVGIIGMANAGKSTLLSKISNAHPKIADYPFTTLTPVLGLVRYNDTESFVVADIPGLIEGASTGRGLGFDFLRHIERTRLYIHVVDPTQGDAYKNYVMINKELKAYNKKLIKRPQVVVINKTELLTPKELKKIKADFKKKKIEIDMISAREKQGLDKVVYKVFRMIKELPPIEAEKAQAPVYVPEPLALEVYEPGVYILRNKRIEKYIAMLDFDSNETLLVFRRYLEKEGLNEFFKQKGVKAGDTIVIADKDFIYEEG